MLRLDATWSPMSTPALLEKGSPSSGATAAATCSGSGGADRRYAGESVILEELRIDGSATEKKVCLPR